MKLRRRLKVAPTIPFIAFADIAWQLVIFFLVASSFAKSDSLKVDLPGSKPDKPQAQQTEPITIIAGDNFLRASIGAHEDVLVPNDYKALKDYLAARLKGRKTEQERAVIVQGRSDLSFQQDVEIMYAVQQAGGVLVMMEEK